MVLGSVAACARAPRPSVVLITIDTLRADHLGCYGYARQTTPRIDALAAQGALFTRAYTSLPRTTQSIASILTGKFPRDHGARGLFSTLSPVNVTLAEVLRDQGYDTAAIVSNMFLRPGRGFEQGFALYDNPPRRWDGDSADEVTSTALSWLRQRPSGRPFFLWLHYLDPHWTYRPSPPYDTLFEGGRTPPALPLDREVAEGRLTKGQIIFQNRLTPAQVDRVVRLYDGEIRQVDAALGPVLEALGRLNPPPLIVLTSDHGESLGEHGYYFAHGEYLYQPTLHIPLILHLPGRIPPGLRSEALAQNIDVAPTILGILGIDRLQAVDGRPLLIPAPASADGRRWLRAAPGRTLVFAESDYQLIHPENPRYYIPGPSGRWSAASDGHFKLIDIPRRSGGLLESYDLQTDPGESRSLDAAGLPPGSYGRLLRELRSFADYGTGPQPEPNPSIDPEER
ncbi:MAG TPA: sulfatase, partial [Candidatus Polarisedimenticolia bacterium]|nr:sulfatase [Candidatus Polarisedimenticolia bacterium]